MRSGNILTAPSSGSLRQQGRNVHANPSLPA
jgi:hypothetical protein